MARAITASHRLLPVASSTYDRQRARPTPITHWLRPGVSAPDPYRRTAPIWNVLSGPTRAANLQFGTFPQDLACSSGHPGTRSPRQPNCGSHPATQAALRLQCRLITGRASIPYPTTDDAGLTSVGEIASRVPDPREHSRILRRVPSLTHPGLHQRPNNSTQSECRIAGEQK